MRVEQQSKRPDLLDTVDQAINSVLSKLNAGTTKVTVADLVRLIQIRIQLEPVEAMAGPIQVEWVSECSSEIDE